MSQTIDETSPKKNESKNGLAFEVILDTAKSTTPAKLTPINTPTRLLTNDDIKNKLQKAEERRQVSRRERDRVAAALSHLFNVFNLCLKSLELMKLSMISEKFQKIEEAAKIREEQNVNFAKQAEQKLLSKMESNKENRTNLYNNLMEKLKKTVSFSVKNKKPFLVNFSLIVKSVFSKDAKIAQIREISNKTSTVLEEKIKNKLISAEENRLEKLNSITERLKEHVSSVRIDGGESLNVAICKISFLSILLGKACRRGEKANVYDK
jgi:hypothetical protein